MGRRFYVSGKKEEKKKLIVLWDGGSGKGKGWGVLRFFYEGDVGERIGKRR